MRFSVLRPHLEDGVPLTRLAEAEGMALRTAQRWVQRYRAQGLAGLARRPAPPTPPESAEETTPLSGESDKNRGFANCLRKGPAR